MAIDVYLHIEGIKGEFADSTHSRRIEIMSVQWSAKQPLISAGSGVGGRTAGRSEYCGMSLAKSSDLASPALMQHCANGKTIPKAKLEFMRADGDKRVNYTEVELENVMIADMEQMATEGMLLLDHVSLQFSEIKWKNSQQRIGDGVVGQTADGWDLSCNKSCA